MHKQTTAGLVLLASILFSVLPVHAQEHHAWTLRDCIDYAMQHNIQIQTQEITRATSEASLEQAKAARYPTLSFSGSFGANFQNVATYNDYMEKSSGITASNNFGLNSGMTLYQGGKLRNTVKQQTLQTEAAGYDVEQQRIDLEISIAQAYIQLLYDKESLDLKQQTADLSARQVSRGEELFNAGSISKVELSQLKSQHATDLYQIVTAENTLENDRLKLKQLLELGLDESFEPAFPEISDELVATPLPELADIYAEALATLPSMKSAALGVDASELAVKVAKGSYAPSISLNAGISTGWNSSTGTTYFDQLGNKLGESVGLNLSLPIFNGKQTKTSVKRAELQYAAQQLQYESSKKQLLSTLESLRNDAVSAQHRYFSSQEQLKAAEESYGLVNEQFEAGIKNTVELLTEKNNYVSALSQLLQAKYQAVLAAKVLGRYMEQPIDL
ncbi:MAG: TolC family protein [Bacteroidales bacterium]|nr:TolC family protein [Bacteroidales bacterium]MBR6424301.1 TolC family protein [Bacteroidales bacterium]